MLEKLKLLSFSKITLQVFISLIYFALILANGIWLFPLISRIRADVAFSQLETANRASDETSNFINGHIEEIGRISGNIVVSGNKESFLDSLLKDKDIQQIVLIDKTGQEIIKVHRYRKIYSEELKNRAGEKGTEQALSTGEVYIGPVFIENLEPLLNVVVPLKASELEIDGALEVILNLKSLWNKVGELKVGDNGVVYIVNTNGMIIAHKDPGVVLSGAYILDKEIARRLIVDKKTVDGLGPESRYLDINGNEVFGVGVPIVDLGWGLIAEQPWKEAFAARTRIIILAVVTLGLSVILLFLLQILISRLVRTTSELTQKYKQLELQKNELDRMSKTLSKKEMQLSESKEHLEKSLTESNKARMELEEAKKGLEIKIQGRTNELEELAESLEVRVKERTKELEESKIALTSILEDVEESRKALMNMLEDVEEEREKVEEEKDKTATIIKHLADGLLVLDSGQRISLINPQAEDLFKIEAKDVIGKFISELTAFPDFKFLAEFLAKENTKVFRKELQIRENLTLEISKVALTATSEGEISGSLLILHDITREKIVERMKTEFVSLAAHQLRTPLSAIKWTLRILLDGDLGAITSEQKNFLEKTYQSNERMISLINDLLNVTRIEEGRYLSKLTLINIEEVINLVVNSYKDEIKRRKIKFEFKKTEEKIPQIMADVEKVGLVVQNLLDNAVHYTRPGGEITISLNTRAATKGEDEATVSSPTRAAAKGEDEATVSSPTRAQRRGGEEDKSFLTRGAKDIEFSIKDTGVEIPKEQRKRIFTKFFRGTNAIKMETEGSGLGLFIAKNIIDAHNGKIWFESRQGEGTTFYFTLPIVDEAGTSSAQAERRARDERSSANPPFANARVKE